MSLALRNRTHIWGRRVGFVFFSSPRMAFSDPVCSGSHRGMVGNPGYGVCVNKSDAFLNDVARSECGPPESKPSTFLAGLPGVRVTCVYN